jgi:hypothetical protein
VVPFQFEITSLFFRDKKGSKETYSEQVVLLDPKGIELGRADTKMIFESEHDRMRNRIKYTSIALTTSGTYIFQIYSGKEDKLERDGVAAIPVDISLKVDGKVL